MMIREVITAILLILGFIFLVFSALGVMRLPDFYTRLHSSGIGETLGIVLIGLGLIIYEGFNILSAKILLIMVSIFLVNPVGTHLIGKAAMESGHRPWEEEHKDSIISY